MTLTTPPEADEYAPFHSGYVDPIRNHDPLELLRSQTDVLRRAVAAMNDTDGLHRYAEGKWSIKEVIGHLADTERVLSYRLMRIGRGDTTPLPGFDEDAYVAGADFNARAISELVEDFAAVRASTLRLVDGFRRDIWSNEGSASNFRVTARGLLYVIPGHVAHHFRLLRERYGLARID